MTVRSKSTIGIAVATLQTVVIGLKTLTPVFQPMKSEVKTNDNYSGGGSVCLFIFLKTALKLLVQHFCLG